MGSKSDRAKQVLVEDRICTHCIENDIASSLRLRKKGKANITTLYTVAKIRSLLRIDYEIVFLGVRSLKQIVQKCLLLLAANYAHSLR